MEQTIIDILTNKEISLPLAIMGLEILLRKIPKAWPILKILSKVFGLLDEALNKVPGLQNKQ